MLEDDPSPTRRLFPFSHQMAALQAASDAVAEGRAGIAIMGEPGAGKTVTVDRLVECVGEGQVAVARLAAGAAPDDVARCLADARSGRSPTFSDVPILVVADDADVMRRDTLDLLNDLAGMVLAGEVRVQLCLAGRPTLIDRLTANESRAMLAHLETRLTLPTLLSSETAAFLGWLGATPDASGRAIPERVLAAATTPGAVIDALRQAAIARSTQRPWTRALPTGWTGRTAALAGTGVGVALLAAGMIAFRHVPSPTQVAPPLAAPTPLAAVEPLPAPNPLAGEPGDGTQPAGPAAPGIVAETAPSTSEAAPSTSEAAPSTPEAEAARDPGPAPATMATPPVPVTSAETVPPASVPAAPGPAPGPATSSGDQLANDVGRSAAHTSRGLILLAGRGDTLAALYRSVYRGVRPPSFEQVAAANPGPLHPGAMVIFPTPPGGWRGE